MKSTMMDFPLTLPHILERAQKVYPEVEVVSRMPDKSLHRTTYGEVSRRAKALAQALVQAGLKPGERVATLMWNHYAHLEAYFGVPIMGGVVHTLNPRLHPEDLIYVMNHAEDRFLIVDDVLLPLVLKLKDHVKLERVIVVSLMGQSVSPPHESYEQFLASARAPFVYPNLDENEAAGMCYSSATTGRPKGVTYSHRALVLHSLVIAATFGLNHWAILCPVVPMFHVNAWGLPYAAMLMGSKLVLPGPHLDPSSLLDLFQAERVSLTAGVPTIWLGMLQALEREPHRWSLHKGMLMVVGGAAAPQALIRGFSRFGVEVRVAWGMTETTPLGLASVLKPDMESLSDDEKFVIREKTGLPVALVEARAITEEGTEVPPDGRSLGELQVRGPYITGSYYRYPEGSNQFTSDGWFRTGDVVNLDERGYFKIVDRTKDLIKSGGEWISSVDLENALMGHPGVAEAAVVAVPHPKWQERPVAVVVLKAEAKGRVSDQDLKAFLAPQFASWWLPDAILFVDEIPRTAAGKFLKRALREKLMDFAFPS
ncbi:MAG: long-chain fatty acid--CoA ligase [Acidobacteriota bacterium]